MIGNPHLCAHPHPSTRRPTPNSYSGIPDCARIVNVFKFAIAKLGVASLWIDYVPSESNPADIPSRFHEMSPSERAAAAATLGREAPAFIPDFADEHGEWQSFVTIARSIWAAA